MVNPSIQTLVSQLKLLRTGNWSTAQGPGYPHTLVISCFPLFWGETAPRELAGCFPVNRKSTEHVSGVLEAWPFGDVQQTHNTVAQSVLPVLQWAQRAGLSVDAPAETCGVQAGQDAA